MSYLKFKVTNQCQLTAAEAAANPVVAVAPICPDYSGSSLFSRLELYHGSNLLEQIHEYNVLHALWSDMTGSAEAQKSTGNVLEGIHSANDRTGASIPLNGTKYFCIPLLSGIVGCMQDKYISTRDISGDDLRL